MSQKWNMNVPWPKDNYIVRIAEAKFGASKRTDNPMITLDLEVVSPETVMVGDTETVVAGTPLKHYLVTKVNDDEEKTKACRERLKEVWDKLKLDFSAIDWDNPDLSALNNMTVWTLLSATPNAKRKDPTSAQKAAGELGDIIIDPITGQKQVTYYPQVETIYGPAQV